MPQAIKYGVLSAMALLVFQMYFARDISKAMKAPGRADFQRARQINENGKNKVGSNGAQGSGILTSFSDANCYVVPEQKCGSVAEGKMVSVISFDRFIE